MTDLSGARVHHAIGCPAHRACDNLPLGVLGVLALDDPRDLEKIIVDIIEARGQLTTLVPGCYNPNDSPWCPCAHAPLAWLHSPHMSPANTGGNIVTPRSHGTNNWIENQVILATL